jgi:histone H2B
MEDVEDREEVVRISREGSMGGDRERITIERKRHVRKSFEEPKGSMTRKKMSHLARRFVEGGSEGSSLALGPSQEASLSESMPTQQPGQGAAFELQKISSEKQKSGRSIPIESAKENQAESKQEKKRLTRHAISGKSGQTRTSAQISAKKGQCRKGFMEKRVGRKSRRTSKPVTHTGPEVTDSFARYIHKVLQQVHPGLGMSKKSISVLDSMVVDMYARLLMEARRLMGHGKRETLTTRDIQGAVRLCLPGELRSHAIAEGVKALSKLI